MLPAASISHFPATTLMLWLLAVLCPANLLAAGLEDRLFPLPWDQPADAQSTYRVQEDSPISTTSPQETSAEELSQPEQADLLFIEVDQGKNLSPPATQEVSVPASRSASQPATQEMSVPASRSASQPATQEVSVPALRSASQPATQEISVPALRSASQPATQEISVPALRSASQPALKSAEPRSSPPKWSVGPKREIATTHPISTSRSTLSGHADSDPEKEDDSSFPRLVPFTPQPSRGDLIGDTQIYETKPNETLLDIARAHELGFTEIMTANPGIDPWLPPERSGVLIPRQAILPNAPREGIVINLPEQRLYFFESSGLVGTYAIGIGQDGLKTPIGKTSIVRRRVKPTWRPTRRMREEDPDLPEVVPPGDDNPLGGFALYLGWHQYLIHGTNKPWGIGRRVSSGCIRLYPEGIADLFPRIKVGTKVRVVDQPIKFGRFNGEIYVEAHPSQAQADEIEQRGKFSPEQMPKLVARTIAFAHRDVQRIDWAALRDAVIRRTGVPVRITWDSYNATALDSDQLAARSGFLSTKPPSSAENTGFVPAGGEAFSYNASPSSIVLGRWPGFAETEQRARKPVPFHRNKRRLVPKDSWSTPIQE